ncbi:uncharacterized protein LOC111338956 [Stylophora pistillata]|uniref:Uncharacterized protein n=1 Tax=Stylophora pistillata TaxID=50429 RepID=A0A2B4RNV6_STYPI|nr:uncharacterized protein LOC111338956 [Stylophora pistillata]PFX18856.1 hypothetical protein AWC38_SpisGene16760 [Stylophora pistillata]
MADNNHGEGNATADTKTGESSSETSENDVKNSSKHESSWKTKMYLLERALEEQQATCNYLREERDTFVAHNRLLKHEVKNLQRGICVDDPENVKSRKYEKGPLTNDMSVIGFILALPRKLVRGLVNRLALFAWWTGTWTNEGLSFLQIENKWVELQRSKYEIEDDNFRLQNQVYALQELLVEKEAEIVRLIERNKDFKNRLDTNSAMVHDKTHRYDQISQHLHALAEFSDNLSEEIEKIKQAMDRRLEKFEGVNRDIGRLAEGQRLLEIAEKNLERRVDNLADSSAHECCYFNSDTLHTHRLGEDATNTVSVQTTLPAAPSEKPMIPSDTDKLKTKPLPQKKSKVCELFCCGCRIFAVFLLAFLITGVLFHFILVTSSLRLPSSPVEGFYGVDLFALWSCFVNWLFHAVVTE